MQQLSKEGIKSCTDMYTQTTGWFVKKNIAYKLQSKKKLF